MCTTYTINQELQNVKISMIYIKWWFPISSVFWMSSAPTFWCLDIFSFSSSSKALFDLILDISSSKIKWHFIEESGFLHTLEVGDNSVLPLLLFAPLSSILEHSKPRTHIQSLPFFWIPRVLPHEETSLGMWHHCQVPTIRGT